MAAVRAHVRARRPLFVSGPAGVGKSALLHAVYADCAAGEEGAPVFYCGESASRRRLTTHMLVNQFLTRGRLQSSYIERREAIRSLSGLRRFVSREPLADLTRMMQQNLPHGRICLLLDHLHQPARSVASLIEVWLETTPLILVARHPEDLGPARWLLSGFDHLEIAPLDTPTLVRIARQVTARLGGEHLREAELHAAAARARGCPRRLVQILRAAVQPEYRKRGTIQWKLVDIDLRIRLLRSNNPRSPHPCGREERHDRNVNCHRATVD